MRKVVAVWFGVRLCHAGICSNTHIGEYFRRLFIRANQLVRPHRRIERY